MRFADDPEVRHRIVFLPNYDIAMAQPLYPGCDVWLNNPLRPYEACGTSGMKAALNGGLNLSILDGWWDEWYDGNNGWAIPSADGVDDPDRRDDLEATALYDLIENEVAPRFYDVDADGVPTRWIEMVRHTLKSLGPKVLATRMVRDYVAQALHAGRRQRRARSTPTTPARASWPPGRSRSGRAGPTSASSTSSPSGVGDAPEVGDALTVRAFVSLGDARRPTTSTSRSCTARSTGEDDLVARPRSLADASPRPTRAAAPLRRRPSPSTTPAPFGYTVRVLPQQRPARLPRRARRRRAAVRRVGAVELRRLDRCTADCATRQPRADDDCAAPRVEHVAGLDGRAGRAVGVGGEHDLAGLHPVVLGQGDLDRGRRRR